MSSDTEAKGAEATSNRFYEVFEPYCKWNTLETLDIELKGFKKEEIKVQTNNMKRILVIRGERAVDATKWSRFRKMIKLSEEFNLSEIRAKFCNGVLSIVIPKQGKEAEKERCSEAVPVGEGTDLEASHQQHSCWRVRVNKNATKVAVLAVAVVALLTIGTQLVIHRPPKQHAFDDKAVKQPDPPKPSFNIFKSF